MRRRKKGNPLLFKIVGFVILLHIIALPILAKMGVFSKVEKQYTEATMVNLPPVEKEKEPPKKAEAKKAPPKQVARASAPHAASHAANTAHDNVPQPKLIAGSGGPAGGDDGGFAVNPNGTGKAGQLTTNAVTPTPAPVTPTPAPVTPTPAPAAVATTRQVPTATPPPTPAPPAPPVYTEPQVVYAPTADLPQAVLASLNSTVDATAIVEIAVDTDGKPSDAKIIQSAGSGDLDQQALLIAAKYRFKPATRDGVPVEGAARVHIEFQVN